LHSKKVSGGGYVWLRLVTWSK